MSEKKDLKERKRGDMTERKFFEGISKRGRKGGREKKGERERK